MSDNITMEESSLLSDTSSITMWVGNDAIERFENDKSVICTEMFLPEKIDLLTAVHPNRLPSNTLLSPPPPCPLHLMYSPSPLQELDSNDDDDSHSHSCKVEETRHANQEASYSPLPCVSSGPSTGGASRGKKDRNHQHQQNSFSKDETTDLLRIVQRVNPTDPAKWQLVQSMYNSLWLDNKKSVDTLRNKFTLLKTSNTKKRALSSSVASSQKRKLGSTATATSSPNEYDHVDTLMFVKRIKLMTATIMSPVPNPLADQVPEFINIPTFAATSKDTSVPPSFGLEHNHDIDNEDSVSELGYDNEPSDATSCSTAEFQAHFIEDVETHEYTAPPPTTKM